MSLQNACRAGCADRSLDHVMYCLCLVSTRRNQDNLPAAHDIRKTCGDCHGRHLGFIMIKETCIIMNRLLFQMNKMHQGIKWRARFIESNVAIRANAQYLQIN